MNAQSFQIYYVSPLEGADPANDNIDIHLRMLVATPNNIYSCMDNSQEEYFFGVMPIFVRVLDTKHVEEAISVLLSHDDGGWLSIYGTPQMATG